MYIRTKDGVYEVDEIKPYFLDEKQKLFINNELKIAVNENQVIKQADTIEELCDGFYIDKCKEEFLLDEMFDDCWYDFNLYFKDCAKSGIDVYGFIKTDKGLIYVAKMNDKGDLELI